MKLIKQLACGVLAATCIVGFVGCSKDGDASKTEAVKVDASKVDATKPKVADGFTLAVMVRAPESTSLAPLSKKYGLTVSDLIKKTPDQIQQIVKLLGADKAELTWAAVSIGGEFEEDKVPDFAFALATNLDLDKAVVEGEKILQAEEGNTTKFNKKTIAGVPAYEIVAKDAPAVPCVVSLGGKLIIVGSSAAVLEKQLFLYCEGKGANAGFASFGQDGNDVVCVKALKVGENLKKLPDPSMLQMVNGIIPDGDKILLGLSAVELALGASADGKDAKLDFTAETASDVDAGKLVATAKQFAKLAKEATGKDAFAKLASDALQSGKIESNGKVAKLSAKVPAEQICALITESLK